MLLFAVALSAFADDIHCNPAGLYFRLWSFVVSLEKVSNIFEKICMARRERTKGSHPGGSPPGSVNFNYSTINPLARQPSPLARQHGPLARQRLKAALA